MTYRNHYGPFNRTYWVIPGRFLAGAYPGGKDPDEADLKLAGLLRCGIVRVINLMEEGEKGHLGEPFVRYEEPLSMMAEKLGIQVSTTRIPIRDANVPSRTTMRSILDKIDESIDRGRPVYVHCWGGRGRTGTVVGCYLVRHGLTGSEALDRIAFLRRYEAKADHDSPETDNQRAMVLSWKE